MHALPGGRLSRTLGAALPPWAPPDPDACMWPALLLAGITEPTAMRVPCSFESSIPEKAKEQQDKPLVAATTLTAVILQNFATVQETVRGISALSAQCNPVPSPPALLSALQILCHKRRSTISVRIT